MVEDELVALATALRLVLKVVHSPSALGFGELRNESLVVGIAGFLDDDNLCVVRAEAKKDVFMLLAELNFLESVETGLVHSDAGCLSAIMLGGCGCKVESQEIVHYHCVR